MSLTSLTTGISDYATRRAIQQLASKLNHDSKPTFAGLTINGESISDALIAQWSTAYSWGDHAGLYDAIGTAEGEVSDHEATYDHTLLHNPVTLGTANGLTLNDQELSLPTTATPTLAGLTLTGMSGVVKTTAGVFSGSATLDDMADGTTNVHLTTTLKTSYDGAASHKTTEDAINGLVSCNGTGTYSAKAIGTDVQAYSSLLAAIAGLTPTDGNIVVGDGSTWVAESGATARTSLGLGTTATPTFASLVLTGTSNPLYAGPWAGAPSPIEAHTNIYQSIYCGNDGANVGRFRIGSNVNAGFLQWNRYWDGSASQQMDAVKPSWSLTMEGNTDAFVIQRSPAGSTTLADVLEIDGATSNATLTGTMRANGGFNDNGIDGIDNSGTGVPTALTISGGIITAVTKNDYLNQAVKTTSSPSFVGVYASTGTNPTVQANDGVLPNQKQLTLRYDTTNDCGVLYAVQQNVAYKTLHINPQGNNVGIRCSTAGTPYTPREALEVNGKIRCNTAFNLNGTDGVTQAASAGTVCDVTALAGGIATAQTQVTYATDGTYNFDATAGKVSSITITNGRITSITTA